MTRQIRRLLRAAFYFVAMLVAVLSLAPSTALPPVSIGDKAEHVIAYVVLGLLGATSSERGIARALLGLSVFGGVIELLQGLSPGRSQDAIDAVADIAGACIGCGLAVALRRTAPIAIERTAPRRQSRRSVQSVKATAAGASEATDMLFDIPSGQPQGLAKASSRVQPAGHAGDTLICDRAKN